MTSPEISRGDVWDINFDPQIGSEITKIRPAVVLDIGSAKLGLRIVVPITGCQPEFETNISKIRLAPSSTSGLVKESAADAYQVKSLSLQRFVRRRGHLSDELTDDVATAVALLIDAPA